MPDNMFKQARKDLEFWAKVAIEEILHYFRIPEQHDENCFFHSKEFEKTTLEDCWKYFCPRCRSFMRQLKDPLDFKKLYRKIEKIYGLKPEAL